ncbi:MAG: dUTP diphosphatase [Actinomycetota bacterium]|nr:dUTP diphosphatase [Actinomycetota bacterium]
MDPLFIKRTDKDVPLPSYAYPGDAGLDLTSTIDISIEPFERVLIPTGLHIAIPEGHAGLVLPRSGLASKQGLTLANAPGLIDSRYRGEVMIAAINLDPHAAVHVSRGSRIAQLVIIATPAMEVIEVDGLDDTERGERGFGSSGVARGDG